MLVKVGWQRGGGIFDLGGSKPPLTQANELIRATQHEIENVADRAIERVVVDDGHVVPTSPFDEVVLDLADLWQRVEVLL